MKIKTLTQRDASAAAVATRDELARLRRNVEPSAHPLERAREYARAVVGAKMGRLFAAPFVAALTGHSDGVTALSVSPRSTVALVSGAADGEVAVWDLASRLSLWKAAAHAGCVRSVAVTRDGDFFLSSGDDWRVRMWRMGGDIGISTKLATAAPVANTAADVHYEDEKDSGREGGGDVYSGGGVSGGGDAVAAELRAHRSHVVATPYRAENDTAIVAASSSATSAAPVAVSAWGGSGAGACATSFLSLDAHGGEDMFATCGAGGVDVWDVSRSSPTQSFSWGEASVLCVRWNPAESSLLASTGADRGVVLYDVRAGSPLRKTVLAMRANALAWNPREPFAFAVASEDSHVYTFDMRRLAVAVMVHKDHVGAVTDVAFAPTGREFATASYDRTVRLWSYDTGKSRDVYHTKRMQRVFAVRYTADAKFVLSGSDDANVRLWKAQAASPLSRSTPRERAARDYAAALVQRFEHMPEVKRIDAARRVPKSIAKARAAIAAGASKSRRKEANVRSNAPACLSSSFPKPERTRGIVEEIK